MKLELLLAKLKPGEGPKEGPVLPEGPPRTVVEVRGFLAMIEMMREVRKYDFADETLRGIYDTVERLGYVTHPQVDAVLNIRQSVMGRSRNRHREDWED